MCVFSFAFVSDGQNSGLQRHNVCPRQPFPSPFSPSFNLSSFPLSLSVFYHGGCDNRTPDRCPVPCLITAPPSNAAVMPADRWTR